MPPETRPYSRTPFTILRQSPSLPFLTGLSKGFSMQLDPQTKDAITSRIVTRVKVGSYKVQS